MQRLFAGGWRETLSALLLAAALWPAPARASDKEWAVAGKVLTGLAAYSIISNLAREHERPRAVVYAQPQPRYIVVESPATRYAVTQESVYDGGDYITPRSRVAPQPSRVEVHNYYYGTNAPANAKPAPAAPATPAAAGPTMDAGDVNTVILNIEEGRRIIQPRTRGAKAYLQVWSDLEKKWLSVKEYPSIY